MKKKLAGILATLACLACFSSCAQLDGILDTVKGTVGNVKDKITELLPGGEEKKEASENLPAAKSYLDSIYKAGNGSATVASYNLMGNVPVKNGDVTEKFTVTWTVDKTDYVEVVKNENGSYTVNIKNKEPKEDIVYTLKAVIADANGFTVESTFTRKIPLVKYTQAEIVDMAYALEKGATIEETLTLTGVISMVESPYDEGYKNITVIIRVPGKEDKPIECYRLKGEGADAIDVGDTITVSGTLTNYNGTIEFAQGCELISAEQTGPEKPNFANDEEIVNAVYALEDGYSLVGGKYELTGKITKVDNAYDAGYGNATFTIVVGNLTDKPIVCYRAKGKDIAEVGSGIAVGTTVKVSGVLLNYGGTYEFTAGCLIVEHDAKLDEVKLPDPLWVNLNEGANTINLVAGQIAQAALFGMGEYTLTWTGAATITVNGEIVTNGATVALNPRSMIEITPVDATAACEVVLTATKYEEPATPVVVGANAINVTVENNYCEGMKVKFTATEAGTYTISPAAGEENADVTIIFSEYNAEWIENFPYEFTLAEGESVNFLVCTSAYMTLMEDTIDLVIAKAASAPAVTLTTFTADLDTLVANPKTYIDKNGNEKDVSDTSYTTRETTNGWKASGARKDASTSSGYDIIGEGNTAITLNGKTSAPGSLTSPVFEGTLKSVSFNYGLTFTDTQFALTINVKDEAGTVVATKTLEQTDWAKGSNDAFTWELDTAVNGKFTIEIVNNCKSAQDKNKDRLALWNIAIVVATPKVDA